MSSKSESDIEPVLSSRMKAAWLVEDDGTGIAGGMGDKVVEGGREGRAAKTREALYI